MAISDVETYVLEQFQSPLTPPPPSSSSSSSSMSAAVTSPDYQHHYQHHQLIARHIAAQSRGVFLYARLVVELLRRRSFTVTADVLSNLPTDLNQVSLRA